LKDELAFRPIHHSKGSRAEAHIFIAVLAYHLLNAIRYQLKASGLNYSWTTIRKVMSTHRRASISGITKDKVSFTERITTAPEPIHIRIYRALNLPLNPLKNLHKKGEM
jgi:transposase